MTTRLDPKEKLTRLAGRQVHKTYVSTHPCIHGHVNPVRYTKGNGCVQCINGRKRLEPGEKAARKGVRVDYRKSPEFKAKMDALLMSQVNQTGGPDSCWLWTGYVNDNGYGYVTRNGKPDVAHRTVYKHLVGPIPDGLSLDHLCRNRACCNPKHLDPVTNKENLSRGNGTAARFARRTHCNQGHEYNAKNTRVTKLQGRVCRICERARATGKLKGGVLAGGETVHKAAAFDRIIGRVHQHMREYINQEAP